MSRNPRLRRRHGTRRPRLEILENRRVMAAELPLGATPQDTGEFLLGRVAVTPIFLESDGSIDTESQNWTPGEIDAVLANITAGVNWWTEALEKLDTVHTLEFVIDDTYARNPVPTGFEPIDRVSNNYGQYVGDFLDYAGVDASLQLDAGMFAFNNSQREKLQTDWAFSLFIADSSDDEDGFFDSGGSFRGAFAFAGGLYIVSPSTRPITTFAHEMGHIFWALDEYPGGGDYSQKRGYYDTQNLNAWDNPTSGFEQEISMMAGYDLLVAAYGSDTSPASTLALVGWQDSDGDGIFDVLDVPLNLDGSGSFNARTSQFDFTGSASVGTLPNRNSSGPQSDITLNRVSRLEVAINQGDWTTVATPNTYTATFDLSVDVPSDFASIAFRVVDGPTGITSETWTAGPNAPLRANNRPLAGYAYLDTDSDGNRASGEPLLRDIKIQVTAADGGELPRGSFDAADLALNNALSPVDGITLIGEVLPMSTNIQVRPVTELSNRPLFQVFDSQLQTWTARLNDRVSVSATLNQPTSHVEVDVVGLPIFDGGVYARVEGFDAAGNLVDRSTTDLRNVSTGQLARGQQQTLRLYDPSNTIVSIRVAGHAGTSIALAAIRTGIPGEISTDAHGGFSIENLPTGQYTFTPVANQVTHRFDPVVAAPLAGTPLLFAARLVDSPRFNSGLPQDVSGDGIVTAVDALQVINDLNTRGSRTLSWSETLGNKIDVTNDGVVTALDALRVINFLNQRDTGSVPGPEPLAHEALPAATHPQSGISRSDSTFSAAADLDTLGIDEVLSEPIKWISPPVDELLDEPSGLIFDDKQSASHSSTN